LREPKSVIEEARLDANLKIYKGGGCNSAVLTSSDGKKVLIVDTKYFKGARELRKAVTAAEITIVNTHFHMDHARGNRLYPDAYVVSGLLPRNARWQWYFDTGFSRRPDKLLGPGEQITFGIDDEKIHVFSVGRAHSLNDSVVFFERRRLLMAGDLVWENAHPVLIGSSITAWRSALKTLEIRYPVGALVPGHGIISDMKAITGMEAYFDSIAAAVGNRDRIDDLRRQYARYSAFPLFSGVDAVVRLIEREAARNR